MKNIVSGSPFFTLLLVMITACNRGNGSDTPTPATNMIVSTTISPLPTMPYLTSIKPLATEDIDPNTLARIVQEPDQGFLSKLLSPDSKWIISQYYFITDRPQSLSVSSTLDAERATTIPLGKNLGMKSLELPNGIANEMAIASWSPDSTAFVATGTNGGWPRSCNYLAMFNLYENGTSGLSTYDWAKSTNCPGVTWSPDGSKLALVFDDGILVLNRSTKLINQVDWTENKSDLIWTGKGILILASDFGGREAKLNRLYLIDPNKFTRSLIFSYNQYPDGSLEIVGWNPDVSYLLLYDTIHYKLFLFDVRSDQILEYIPLVLVSRENMQYSRNYVSLVVESASDSSNHLVVFDWRNKTLQDYGNIRRLIGWYSGLNGYLVQRNDNRYAIVIP
jgi:hypothetical protein